jgi:rhodanese-related sulfurtransferase
MHKRIVSLVILALVLSTGLLLAEDMTPQDLVAAAKKEITSITVAEAKELLDKGEHLFLDVREPDEVKMGNIPGAVNIPRGLLEFRIGAQVDENRDAKIVVYCKSGGRSSLATQSLKKLGYKNALNMDGGWTAWEEAGYPVE